MGNELQVLLIDDNPDDRMLATREMHKAFPRLSVTEVMDPEGFKRALENDGFDMVITDYHLNWTDGIAVLAAVRGRFPLCPVIMFTGTGSEEIAVAAMKQGLDDYVLKSRGHFSRLPIAMRTILELARERRELETARLQLRERERKYRLFFENTLDVIYLLGPDTTLLSVSPSVETVLGYKPEELVGSPFSELDILEPESLQKALADTARVLEGESIRAAEYVFITKDGSWRIGEVSDTPLIHEGRVVKIFGVARDITSRRQSEAERARLVTAIEQAAEVIVITDKEGDIQYANPAFERATGYTPKEVLGRNPRILKSGVQDRAFYRDLWRTITGGEV